MARRLPRPTPATLIAFVALFVALGGTSVALNSAGVPDPAGVFHACVNKRTGALRLVNKGARCRTRATKRAAAEKAIEWSQTGPAGPSDGYYSNQSSTQPASITVPPGNYIADGGCTASQAMTSGQSTTVPSFGSAQAFLTTSTAISSAGLLPTGTVETHASVPNMGYTVRPINQESGSASLSNSGGFDLPQGGTIYELCRQAIGGTGTAGSDEPVTVSDEYVTAIRVSTLH